MKQNTSFIKRMQDSSLLFGANASFVEALYEQYLLEPASVPVEWRDYFDSLQAAGVRDVAHSPIQRAFAAMPEATASPALSANADMERKQVYVLQLINSYRFLGLRVANLDPLARHEKPVIAELDPAYYGLNEADMDSTFATGSLVAASRLTLREILQLVRQDRKSVV